LANQYSKPFEMNLDADKTYTASLETNKGTIDVEFFTDDAPNTVNNFVSLAKDGYYDGTPFHRIISGFMVQGGDPTGTGMGGPGYKFADEPVKRKYERGTLAMANAGPNTNGSQFFIVTKKDGCPWLDGKHTVFGDVVQGMDVVEAIQSVPTQGPDLPVEPVVINSIRVKQVKVTLPKTES